MHALRRSNRTMPEGAAAVLTQAGAQSLVAVLGLDPVGRRCLALAVQLGCVCAAVVRGRPGANEAAQLGATHVIDAALGCPAAALSRLGGAKVILTSAATAGHWLDAVDGLRVRGGFYLVGGDLLAQPVSMLDLLRASVPLRRPASMGFAPAPAWPA